MTKEEKYTITYLLGLINEVECPMLMYEHEKEVVKRALMEYTKEEKNKENGISYYAIENTIDEIGNSRITGRYATLDEARNDMKNHQDCWVIEPSGRIYHIREWFEGFKHKVEKKFIERHWGNEIRYNEYR